MKRKSIASFIPQPRKSVALAYRTPRNSTLEPANLSEKDEAHYKIVEIIKKPVEFRTPDEIQLLMKMTENMPFFQKIGSKTANSSQTHAKCCKLLRYRMLPKGTAAIYYGDMPDCFYLILKGSAVVLLPKDPEQIYKEKEKLRQKFKKMQREAEQQRESQLNSINEEEHSPKLAHSPTNSLKKPAISPKFSQNPAISNEISNEISVESPFIPSSSTRHAIKSLQKVTKMMSFLNASSLGSLKQKLDQSSWLITPQMREEVASLGLKLESLANPRHYFDGQVFRYFFGGVLSYGQTFGELGLLRKKPRAATVVCLENTHFGILQKVDYETIYFELQHQKLKNLIKFFKSSLDEQLSNDAITKYAYLFEKRKLGFGDVVYKEGDKAERVFLIKKGEISLNKASFVEKKLGNTQDFKGNLHWKAKVLRKSRGIAVGVLRKGDYFGDDEVLHAENRKFTAVCASSKATVFFIDKTKFSQCLDEFKEIHRIFLSRINSKQSWHSDKIKQVQETRKTLEIFCPSLRKPTQFSSTMKCSSSELQEIIALRTSPSQNSEISVKFPQKTENSEIFIKQYRSKHAPGSIIRGLRANNRNLLISDYPLTKNFATLNRINGETLKNLLKSEDLSKETLHTQTESIALGLRNANSKKNFDVYKRKLQGLLQTKAEFDYFPFRNASKTYVEKWRDRVENEVHSKKSGFGELFESCGINIEGNIEKTLGEATKKAHRRFLSNI